MNALVTGGTRGIGRAIVDALIADGHRVMYFGKSNYDLTKREERKGVVRESAVEMGGLDILVNNAGEQIELSANGFIPELWDRQLSFLLTAPFELSQQAYPYLKESGRGRIINIASVAGINGT
jgi:NAD(P)-dependent dehydrogenase (short-subunit alcohol dehydrogenase family)